MKLVSNGFVENFKSHLVVKDFTQINGLGYQKTCIQVSYLATIYIHVIIATIID